METAVKPGMTKRKSLLALVGAAPALAYGQQAEEAGLEYRVALPPGSGTMTLLQVSFDVKAGLDAEVLFLRVLVNGKEEVRVSLREALDILKG